MADESDPYQAQFCGGTLIRPSWVLTAAHCVGDLSSASQLEVAIGINDLATIQPLDRKSVSRIFIHPGWYWDENTSDWDFALLQLRTESSQPTMDLISPTSPQQIEQIAGGKPARIAGWGCTLQVPKGDCPLLPGGFPSQLLQANVQFVSNADCGSSAAYGSQFNPATMICAGVYPAGGRDTCFGDSGGPAVATVGSRQVLAGVTSWGSAICGITNKPGVFARVTAGLPWIQATTSRAEPDGTVTPTRWDFGKRSFTAGPSAPATFTVTSTGDAPLTIEEGGIALTGTGRWDFDISGGTCKDDGTGSLDPGESCSVEVVFNPEFRGPSEAYLEFETNAGSAERELQGFGTGGKAKIGSLRVAGPEKVRRDRPVSYRVSIANDGAVMATDIRLKVSGRGVSGSKSVGFVPPGWYRTVKVRVKFRKAGKLRAVFKANSTKAGSKRVTKIIRVMR